MTEFHANIKTIYRGGWDGWRVGTRVWWLVTKTHLWSTMTPMGAHTMAHDTLVGHGDIHREILGTHQN